MARKIGALSTTLTLKSQSFTRGIKKASFSIKRFGRSMRGMVSRLKSFSLVSGVSVGAFGFLVRQQLKAADASAKLSARLGISIGALEGFRLAAELGGASIEGADNALQQFARRLGDAQGGTGEYADAIKELGLNSAELAAVPLDVALGQVADKIKGLSNVTLKANAAYNLFGRQGIKLLNTLADGSEGLAKARKEIEGMGLATERFDVRKIEQANDALTRLRFTVQGAARSFSIGIVPLITAFADQIRATIPNMKLFGEVAVEVLRSTALSMAFLGRALLSLVKPIAGMRLLFEFIGGSKSDMDAARKFAEELRLGLKDLSADSINDFFDNALERAAKATGGLRIFTNAITAARSALSNATRSPFSAAVEQGSQAAVKAEFKFNRDKKSTVNATLLLGRDILRELKRQARNLNRAGSGFNSFIIRMPP